MNCKEKSRLMELTEKLFWKTLRASNGNSNKPISASMMSFSEGFSTGLFGPESWLLVKQKRNN